MQMKTRMGPGHTFQRVWWPVMAAGIISAIALYWSLRMLVLAWNDDASGRTWTLSILVTALFISIGPYLFWTLIRDVVTTFTDDGIVRPTVFGWRMYLWRDLVRIDSRGNYGVLVFNDGNVGINLSLFREPRRVVSFVRAHLPPNAQIEHAGLRDGSGG